MTNLFITLTESTTSRKLRLQLGKIAGYETHVPMFVSTDNPVEQTVVYVDHPEACFFVKETPEEIDKILKQSYVTVYGG